MYLFFCLWYNSGKGHSYFLSALLSLSHVELVSASGTLLRKSRVGELSPYQFWCILILLSRIAAICSLVLYIFVTIVILYPEVTPMNWSTSRCVMRLQV
jgi:hypothetical protein